MSQDSCDDEKPSQPPVDGNHETHASENHQQVSTHQEGERPAFNPTFAQPSSKEDQWHSDEKTDRDRQIRLSYWLNWITGIGGAIAIGALVVLYLQADSSRIAADAARISADVSKATLIATQRPWISVNVEVAGEWENGSTLKAKYTIKNYGPTPAIEVHFNPSIMQWEPNGDSGAGLGSRQREMCEQAKHELGFGHPTIVPHEEWIETVEIGLGKKIKESTEPDLMRVFIYPFLIGCITYRFTFDNSIHQTPYAFSLSRRDTKDPSHLLAMRIDIGAIQVHMLVLTPAILKGGAVPD